MKANEVPERYKTCDWLWNYGSIGLTKEHIKRLNNAINILESVYEYTDAKYLKEIKDKLLEDSEIIDPKEVAEFVFPELKESDDERIRKWLIGVIKSNEYGNISNVGEMPCPKPNVIAWLEKQGEILENIKYKEAMLVILQKMKEAGYEWDAEKKELKKIEQKSIECIQWTGKNLKEVIDFTGKSARFDEWFKSWDEYEAYVHSHGDIFKLFCADGSHYEVPVGAWIIKTPDGCNTPSQFNFIQKSTEWSEEDEDYYDAIIAKLEVTQEDALLTDNQMNFLKSLKERVQPKTTWLPSEEQIEAVKCAALDVSRFSLKSEQLTLENESYYKALLSLYDDLKKLKEE